MDTIEAIRLNKQSALVLSYLRAYGSITPSEALSKLSCMRLAARIHDLKRAGYDIRCEIERLPNRLGEPCRVARYSLERCEEAVQGRFF